MHMGFVDVRDTISGYCFTPRFV